jgi:ribonuclease D
MSRPDYEAPNLRRLMAAPQVLKIFHFGRFDIAMFQRHLGVLTKPVYCTKIASKLARTYTDRHGLKDVTRELLGIEVSKAQQSSDWGATQLTAEQLAYAASDVLNLHALKTRLDDMLIREGRMELARACFDFLPHRAALDVAGWDEMDIFAHD